MTTAARERRLSLRLPVGWTQHDIGDWAAIRSATSINPTLVTALPDETSDGPRPDVVASNRQILTDDSGAVLAVLLASVVVTVVPTEPDTRSGYLPATVRRGVLIIDGVRADFVELTAYVVDHDLGVSALVTFTTPNLPLVAEMEPGFRSIVDSISFVPSGS